MNKRQIKPLESVQGSVLCKYSVIENELAKLYRNQEKIYKLLQDVYALQLKSPNDDESNKQEKENA